MFQLRDPHVPSEGLFCKHLLLGHLKLNLARLVSLYSMLNPLKMPLINVRAVNELMYNNDKTCPQR